MSVTRYELTTKYRGNESWDELEENPEGAYVRHGDYAALEQRLIESERYGRQTDITIDNLEMKLAQMTAENAGLKEIRKNLAEFIHEELDAGYPLNMDIETSATDAFMAEVRAQGVEIFASVLESRGRHQDYVEIANAYAAQIRKGVQS